MVEVFTIGGGEYLVNVFNAVAAWTGGGGYKSLLRVVMVMGLIYTLLVVAFTLNWRAWFNWFLQATLMYGVLMVPTVDVRITDRVNPSLAAAVVDNVPRGLGILASFTSQVGDYLTRTSETVFVMPSQLNYTSNGMIYGSRLLEATRNFQIRDAEFATNLEEHFKRCTFGDIMLYRKSLTDLARATDLWAAIGPGSPARAQQWAQRNGDGSVTTSIVTCNRTYQMLTAQWTAILEAHAPLWGKEVYPKLTNAAAAAKLKMDVPVVAQAFTGSGSSFHSQMRQMMAINAFLQARSGMSGGTGSASLDTFAQVRADLQARNTYNSIAQQAMTWVPILHIVLTVVFFAMFPVIFPLFLMPQTGVGTLKGYVTGFFYLAAWGPIYVVLHMICTTRAETAAKGVTGTGMTLASFEGIGAVNAEAATIAGFMLMSVPFLAAGMARGAMSIAGHSMSMLAPAQNAAEQAANEQTTGNYAYGNVSWANHTSNMRQSDQWSTAPSFSTGAAGFTTRHDNGATSSTYGNGRVVDDMSGAMSRLDVTPDMSFGLNSSMSKAASWHLREAEAIENSLSQTTTAAHTDRSGTQTTLEHSQGFDSGQGWQSGTNVERSDRQSGSKFSGNESRSGTSESYSHTKGLEDSTLLSDSVNAGAAGKVSRTRGQGSGGQTKKQGDDADAGGGGGGGGRAPGLGIEASAGLRRSFTQNEGMSDRRARTIGADESDTASSGTREERTNGLSASESNGTYARGGSFERDSLTTSSTSGSEDSLSEQRSAMATARKHRERAEQLMSEARYSQDHGMRLSQNLSNELSNWYRQEQAKHPNLNAPEIWATDMNDTQREIREGLIARWMDEKSQSILNEINPQIREPDLVDVKGPDFDSVEDVRGSYSPRGVGSLPMGPTGGDPNAAGRIIEEGGVEVGEAINQSKSLHNQRRIGSSGLKSKINSEQFKEFFNPSGE
ncbi:conjugal transfer mating pair stabilization protein TraG [Sphingomonas zeicaulis]|uniref:conjugal transfer protein TraG N-terminal domain-containing protein n=1 Tax=Sphingomonas zeicaulis TaxID=1632740 RepID=UPI003D206527